MHEQEFERSVQQKMEELSFTPSAPVWEKVEKEISENRRRRRPVLWVVPLGLLLAAGGWWLADSTKHADAGSLTQPVVAAPVEKIKPQSGPEGSEQNIVIEKRTFPLLQKASATKEATAFTSGKKPAVNNAVGKAMRRQVQQTVLFPSAQAKNTVAGITAQPSRVDAVQTTGINLPGDIAAPAVPLTIQGFTQNLLQAAPQPIDALALLQKEKQRKAASGWQWGVQVQYGFSGAAEAGFLKNVVLQGASDPQQNNGPGFGLPPRQQLKSGAYYSGGLLLQRKLSRSLNLATGIQYAQYNQRASVGEAVQRSTIPSNASFEALQASVFYRATNTNKYFTNRYQLLSVPVALQLKPFRKLPLEARAGVVAGYLLHAKALGYDTASRLYYAYRPALQRLQVQLNGGLQYRVAQTKKWEWLAGPQMHYHLSRLYAGKDKPKRLYAFSLGLQVRKK